MATRVAMTGRVGDVTIVWARDWLFRWPGGCLIKAYDVTIQRYRKWNTKIKVIKMHILWCMFKILCKISKGTWTFWTHTPQSMHLQYKMLNVWSIMIYLELRQLKSWWNGPARVWLDCFTNYGATYIKIGCGTDMRLIFRWRLPPLKLHDEIYGFRKITLMCTKSVGSIYIIPLITQFCKKKKKKKLIKISISRHSLFSHTCTWMIHNARD